MMLTSEQKSAHTWVSLPWLTAGKPLLWYCRSCGLHIHNVGKIVRYLTPRATGQLVHAFIVSRLDSCNALLHGLPDDQVRGLQLIQNTAARQVTRTRKHEHITPVLRRLHWLPVRERIHFKILLLAFKCQHRLAPGYLAELLVPNVTDHIRSSVQHMETKWWCPGLFLKFMETEPSAMLHLSCGTVNPSTCACVIPSFHSRLDWKFSFLSVLSNNAIIPDFYVKCFEQTFQDW